MRLSLSELAERLALPLRGDGSIGITGVAGIREAKDGDVTFLGNPRYEAYLGATLASAILMPASAVPKGFHLPVLESDRPYADFLKVLVLFASDRPRPPIGIHPTAVISTDARIGLEASIGPHVVIEDGASLGNHATVMAGCYLGRNVMVSDDCLIYPNVVIREESRIGRRVIIHAGAIIGDDGFGFIRDGDEIRKIPQIGNVEIGDDCEIGANTTIDRATTGTTTIGRGTRIDNLVMIAHNVHIGENSILCAQVGISGSATIGRDVTIGGQAGVVGHIEIGDHVRVGAQAGVTKPVASGVEVSGYPAMVHSQARRISASMRSVPEIVRLFRDFGRRLAELEKKTTNGGNRT
jgi:UDP-3-O-[3-hydroxymyristoyl] glucosamine N-acyltransferase